MASSVNNPTNAKPYRGQPLPFTTKAHVEALARAKPIDGFNSGKDYKDEGAPLLEGDKPPSRLGWAITPGFTNPPTKADFDGFSHPDETSQTQIKYLREAVVMDIDAKLIISTEAQLKHAVATQKLHLFREAHYPTLADYVKSPYYRKLRESRLTLETIVKLSKNGKGSRRLQESDVVSLRFNPRLMGLYRQVDRSIFRKLKESGFNKEMKKLREQGGFPEDIGNFGQPSVSGFGGFQSNWDGGTSFELAGREPDFTPLIAGPYNKQLYWFDYLDMHSKAFEAWTHNPIAKRICKVITQFVLGKGVKVTVMRAEKPTKNVQQDPKTGQTVPVMQDFRKKCQSLLDQHWVKNTMHIRSKQILRDLIIFGEQFPRYFDAPWGLKVRQIDPSTVWEVITDPDDCENEFYLHQQYPTRYQWYVDLPVPTIKFIIRQVPSLLYYHMKINSTAGEVRGRSELFAILGWLKRLKEFASDRVIRNKMGNLFVLDVAVEGDASAVEQAKQQFAGPPTPGSFFIHNKAAELKGVASEIGASEMQGDWELLLTVISMGAGLSQEYLGMGSKGGKAQALVGTEPDIKTFEDYQELMEQFFLQDSQRVFTRHKERGEIPRDVEISVEITYPALAEENRSEKLKDLAFGESMSWWSHRRVASASAKEMQMTSYDYDEEQQQIAEEDAQKMMMINTAYQQVTKGEDSSKAAAAATGGGSGGTSSGSSGKGASGMGMGKMGAGGGSSAGKASSGGGHFESVREADDAEAEDDAEALPATAPGTAFPAKLSTFATTHNASKADGKRDPYEGRDPRDVAESIKREATNLRYDRRGIGRRQDRIQSPHKVRDQKSLDRGEIVTKAKKALKSGNLGHESQGGVRGTDGHVRFPREAQDPPARDQNMGALTQAERNKRLVRQRGSRESMEPFKTQDGEKLQRPRHEDFPTEKSAHQVSTGKRNSPRGFGANKREYPN
jgi:hypothetical protein